MFETVLKINFSWFFKTIENMEIRGRRHIHKFPAKRPEGVRECQDLDVRVGNLGDKTKITHKITELNMERKTYILQ